MYNLCIPPTTVLTTTIADIPNTVVLFSPMASKGTKNKQAIHYIRPIKLYFQAGIVHADLKPANVLWSQDEVGDVIPTSMSMLTEVS